MTISHLHMIVCLHEAGSHGYRYRNRFLAHCGTCVDRCCPSGIHQCLQRRAITHTNYNKFFPSKIFKSLQISCWRNRWSISPPSPQSTCLEQVRISYICIYMLRQLQDKNRKQNQLPSKNNSNNIFKNEVTEKYNRAHTSSYIWIEYVKCCDRWRWITSVKKICHSLEFYTR